ncbi:MAG: homocysteine S-methyltransferase family protein [Prevotellaceae bacterium]|jgi:5-methyltetrahydrofolate--homocysteine methyltransferase|nr:homocysteine S-methyltransferase family protein [Prevotellaceae bacterium]
MTSLRNTLKNRILILDGAMGTMIQQYKLTEDDYRGSRFANWQSELKGNNDLLVLTQKEIIKDIHYQYLAAGADIIETNTLNTQAISQSEYGTGNFVREINLAAARLARDCADFFTLQNTDRQRFVAGSIGPTNKLLSLSPDVANPALRAITFDELVAAYQEQAEALIEGGVDALLIETIIDTLNAKAAIYAAQNAINKLNKRVEIMLSATVADTGGRLLSGQTVDAFMTSVAHAQPLSVGLNCSFGAKEMLPFMQEMSAKSPFYTSAYPNAGLPNQFGDYDQTPEIMATLIKEYIDNQLVNIIGGCCGTTPQHIERYRDLIKDAKIRKPAEKSKSLILSGLETLEIKTPNLHNATSPSHAPETENVPFHRNNTAGIATFINIGERCNVAGSRKFLQLIQEKNYEKALQVARQQVEDGAQMLDINFDDGLLDAQAEMTEFLNLISAEPDIAKVPIMLDSSNFEVIEAGLKCLQGKSAVNSISLKEGEKAFLEKAETIRRFGAAAVVMAFDEKGQADTFERKIEICSRAYNLLTLKLNFPPQDIIFDPNILSIGTGIAEHNNYAINFIDATQWIKQHLPHAKVSGGVSNLSFSFRGNNAVREAMHSAFLYHAIAAGMDMGIVNAAMLQIYEEIPKDFLQLVENVIFNRKENATEELIEYAENLKKEAQSTNLGKAAQTLRQSSDEWRNGALEERLQHAIIKGISDFMINDLTEALEKYASPIEIIEKPLMSGINVVGKLFGQGKMFLPQVVKTARTMKRAIDFLQPFIEKANLKSGANNAGKYLIATVKGDVHDIGKNIVAVVLSCNNYEVIDLGVMTPAEKIVETARKENVDFVGLSGLITPSLEEMCNVAAAMQKAGLNIPLLIGGATTSKKYTALKIRPLYDHPVIYVRDASEHISILQKIKDPVQKDEFILKIKEDSELQNSQFIDKQKLLTFEEAKQRKPKIW